MAKINTLEDLEDALSSAIIWRKKELATIKSYVNSGQKISGPKLDCLIRSGISMLYAHWEGFVKESGTFYLDFVGGKKLKYEDLAPNFVAFAMKRKLNDVAQSNNPIIHNGVVEFFLFGLGQRCRFSSDSINTESNLSSIVLKKIVHMLGLDYTDFQSKEKLIDEKLLKKRNHIAHGKYLTVDRDEFLEIFDEVIGLMNLLKDKISNSASLEKYKRIK